MDGITKKKKCNKCTGNTYSEGGINAKCEECSTPRLTNSDRTRCINPADMIEIVKNDIQEQKEKQNDLSIKNSRLWQKEQIGLQHDDLMEQRKTQDDADEAKTCLKQREKGTVLFPAIEISNEIEKIEDTTC